MTFEADEEILQDFLVEAGELLETLSEQLIDLENKPDDSNLLNAIFRGFHTVKGGAGFLQLEPLVDLCHAAENVFDCLRNGKISISTHLMDVVLQTLDLVNEMFAAITARTMPEPAPQVVIDNLNALMAEPALLAAAPTPQVEPVPEPIVPTTPAPEAAAQAFVSNTNKEISDDEFEKLLDSLHGSGKGPTQVPSDIDDSASVQATLTRSAKNNEITDDEFDRLLDDLHGKGKGPTAVSQSLTVIQDESAQTQAQMQALMSDLKTVGGGPKAASKTVTKPAVSPSPAKPAAPVKEAETTVRVDTRRLDEIMNMVGELVLVRNRLVRLGLKSADEAMTKAVANLDVVTADLQMSVMKTRMQPIKKVFGKFPRVVRDLARQLKKEISLELIGEETDLDKNLVEALADPLVHLVRNSVDHGIELPEVRLAKGKPREGKVVLSAQQEGDHIVLAIKDDGGGMDAEFLRNRAVQKNVMDQDAADRLSESDCFNLIFAPGFSTKDQVSDVSGRGVGMDVVKTKISQLNGQIEVKSKKGEGSTIEIKVPLTLAIMPTLMVMLASQTFALPLVSVNEIFHLDLSQTNIVDGQEVVIVRDKALPLFHLKRWLINSKSQSDDNEGHVVVVNVGTQCVGFVVDQLIGQEEVVIKPLGRMLNGTAGMAGATITGDGRIALILDVPTMLSRYAKTA